MDRPRVRAGWQAILVCLLGGVGLAAERSSPAGSQTSHLFSFLPVPEDLPQPLQNKVRLVLQRPAMHARGPVESFRCQIPVYHWLLDHPDRAVKAWRRLGARCMTITDRGSGRFGCKDEQGTDVVWNTIVNTSRQRAWYAEGVVRPGTLLPLVTVRAVFVMHLLEGTDATGRPAMTHQGELFLHTDSKAAALATRLLGASAPRMTEQYVGQIQTFFAALSWYLNEHPQKTETILAE